MRVLVTGGAGFIGSHTVDALLQRGCDVRILDSLETPTHDGNPPDYLPQEAEFIRGSVTERKALRRALQGVDAVFHLAAHQNDVADPARFFQTNSAGTALLYDLIVSERLPVSKVIIGSSQAVYGEGKHLCPIHGAQYPDERTRRYLQHGDWDHRCSTCLRTLEPVWTDETVTAPHSGYALSKRHQEDIALQFGQRYDIPTVVLRYSIVQGARQSPRSADPIALRSFAVRALTGKPPVIYEDGRQLRDYVSIHDVVDANLLVLDDSRADYRAFNVGGERRISLAGLAWMVCHAAGVDFIPETPGVYRLGDRRHIFSDVSRLRALGWEPRVRQAQMVSEYVEWLSQQDLSGAEETSPVKRALPRAA
jgi:dTDP-L-rhamnose 4-epimerase